MTLLVCRTCPRYDARCTGEFGRDLTAALESAAASAAIEFRKVHCLGGCPRHGVVAVDGPGKDRVRFTGLTARDAADVLAAAVAHEECGTGAPEDWAVPESLASRISSVTRKRAPRT